MMRIHDAGALEIIVEINGTVEEMMNIWKQLIIGLVQASDDVVIKIDKCNGALW